MLGPKSKDGNTTLSVWTETPFSDNFLIGGSSNSLEFTEKKECTTNGVGCAYITNWNKVTQEYEQKYIFTSVYDVLDFKFSPDK